VSVPFRYFRIDTAEQVSVMSAFIDARRRFPFFTLPAGKFHNQHVSLDLLWGTSARVCGTFLLEAPTPEAKFTILEDPLRSRMQGHSCGIRASILRYMTSCDSRRSPSIADSPPYRPSFAAFYRRFHDQVWAHAGNCSAAFSVFRRCCAYREIRDIRLDDVRFIGGISISPLHPRFRLFHCLSPPAYAAHRTQHMITFPILD